MKHAALLLLQRQFLQRANMTTIDQRYSSAIRSRDLGVDPKTVRSDSDVLGATALADRTLSRGHDGRGNSVRPDSLAVPLTRLLAGDNHAAREIAERLGKRAHRHSHVIGVHITRPDCNDMAKACLAWFRHGTCKLCGGHGKLLIPGTKTLGDKDCDACHGMGKMPFRSAFRKEWRPLADWLVSQMERALGRAGPQAMAHLAPRFSLGDDE